MSEDPKSPTKYIIVDSSFQAGENDIDLIKQIRTIFIEWKKIVIVTIFCSGFAVFYSLKVQEVFKAEILLSPSQEESSIASSPLGQFGGLAAMAGISIPSSTNTEKVLAILKTREFLKKFIKNKNLLPLIFYDNWDKSTNSWKIEEAQEENLLIEKGILALQEAIKTEKKSSLIELSITWTDPEIAANWANDLIQQLNEQLRKKAVADSQKRIGYLKAELAKTTLQDMRAVLYSLLESEKQRAMLANVNDEFALDVIDPAVTPKFREKPNRKLIVAMGGVCGFFLGVMLVLTRLFYKNLKISNSSRKAIS